MFKLPDPIAADFEVGLIVCSDRASQHIYEDKSGEELKTWCTKKGLKFKEKRVIPDDTSELKQAVLDFVESCGLLLISGGTGLGPRDITPQTVQKLSDFTVPGFGELMRAESVKFSQGAYLSRCGAWMKERTLIIALAGSPKAVVEQLSIIEGLIAKALHSIHGECKAHKA